MVKVNERLGGRKVESVPLTNAFEEFSVRESKEMGK